MLNRLDKAFENGAKIARNSVYSLMFVVLTLFSSCDVKQEATVFDLTAIVDVSSSALDSLNDELAAYQYLMQATSLPLGEGLEGWHGTSGQIQILTVGDFPRGQVIQTVILPPPPVLLFRNPKHRAKQIETFQSELQAALQSAFRARGTAEKTHLNTCLTHELNRLTASTANNKSLLLLSDLVHDDYDISFHRYNRNPRQLLEEADAINARFDQAAPLDSLGDVTITVAYSGRRNISLYLAATEFWQSRLTARNDSLAVSFLKTLKP